VDHLSDHLLKSVLRLHPNTRRASRHRRQQIKLCRSIKPVIDLHIVLVFETYLRKGRSQKSRTVCDAPTCHHIVVGLWLLQHHVHRTNVVSGMSPVSMCVEVAQLSSEANPALMRATVLVIFL